MACWGCLKHQTLSGPPVFQMYVCVYHTVEQTPGITPFPNTHTPTHTFLLY